jgi:hypothetical protein
MAAHSKSVGEQGGLSLSTNLYFGRSDIALYHQRGSEFTVILLQKASDFLEVRQPRRSLPQSDLPAVDRHASGDEWTLRHVSAR